MQNPWQGGNRDPQRASEGSAGSWPSHPANGWNYPQQHSAGGQGPVEYYGPPQFTPQGGYPVSGPQIPVSDRKFSVVFLLSTLAGYLGAHRFYLGRPVTGTIMALLSLGGGGLFIYGMVGILDLMSVYGEHLHGLSDSDSIQMLGYALCMFAGAIPLFGVCVWSVIDTALIAAMKLKDANGAVPMTIQAREYRIERKPVVASDCSMLATALFMVLLGMFGAHRFFVGKVGSAIGLLAVGLSMIAASVVAQEVSHDFGNAPMLNAALWLPSLGFAAWIIVDIVLISVGKFNDKHGRPVSM